MLALFPWLAHAGPPSPAVLAVGPGEPYAEVSAALADAAPGDRILVHPGTYGPVSVEVDVEIVGLDPDTVLITADDTRPAVVVAPLTSPVLRGLVLDGAGAQRALRIGAGASVTVEDATIRDGRSAASGGCVYLEAAALTLRRTTVTGCTAETGGGLFGFASDLALEGAAFVGNVATVGFGGGVGVQGSTVIARGTRFERNVADDPLGDPHYYGLGGGLFTGEGSTLDLAGCTFVANEARSVAPDAGRGAAIRLWETEATITGTRFEGNVADEYGSAVAAASSTLHLEGSAAVGNVVDEADPAPTEGGTVFCDALSTCTVRRSWFEGNTSGDGGGICALGPLEVTGSMFCANTATDEGGAIELAGQDGLQRVRISGNVFALNHAGAAGGGLVVPSGPVAVRNNHLVGNTAGEGAAIAGRGMTLTLGLEVRANLIAANTSAVGPVLALGNRLFVERSDWYHANAPYDTDFVPGSNTGAGDPGLVGPAASCDPEDLALGPDSPLRDGDPAGPRDVDGSPNDIGGFGGPDADPAGLLDGDGDGVVGLLDCDDADPEVRPGADERCNGVDDDCDGLVDEDDQALDAGWLFEDVDRDGVGGATNAAWRCAGPGWSATSDDCDDADPAVGAPGTWHVDADGDGLGDDATATTGCDRPPGAVALGGDCDDADPAVGALCPDTDGDGVADAVDPAPGDAGGDRRGPPRAEVGCGCASGASPGGLAVLLGLAALAGTLRR